MDCAKEECKESIKPPEKEMDGAQQFDDLLRKMLTTPPNPHPKPEKKDAKKKTAK